MTRIWRPWGARDTAVGLGAGLAGGLLAGFVLCPPALSVLLGLGGAAVLASLGAHQTAIRLVAGLGLTLAAAWWAVLRQAKTRGAERGPLPFLLFAVASFGGAYLIVTFAVVPILHDLYHAIAGHG